MVSTGWTTGQSRDVRVTEQREASGIEGRENLSLIHQLSQRWKAHLRLFPPTEAPTYNTPLIALRNLSFLIIQPCEGGVCTGRLLQPAQRGSCEGAIRCRYLRLDFHPHIHHCIVYHYASHDRLDGLRCGGLASSWPKSAPQTDGGDGLSTSKGTVEGGNGRRLDRNVDGRWVSASSAAY